DIVNNISSKAQFSKTLSSLFLKRFFSLIINNKNHKVVIPNFGSFFVKNTIPRIGRNPETMKEFKIHSRKKFSFKPSNSLKNTLN
ncbi:HU family DNA-binding protein, partial [Gammaproteobacteria bacterium]|nr:HU family DNA-binding protein [Gammaproteobacteria bacterium]